ncbi:WhiB family transcriptional regulator [Streptomyces rimosus]|uniref:WhiB family transcriptional regulator n=1 Tax=Streptomyces rimosus TaxID=1927 RepID=UPI00099DE1C0|nr:WhiB family transcriptional regulator [Streptomyces rimosus]
MTQKTGQRTSAGQSCVSSPAAKSGTAHAAWQHHAACRGEDPDLFFPRGWSIPYQPQIESALAICDRCPVRAACLYAALAMEHGKGLTERAGIWGGTTAPERHRMTPSRPRRRRQTTASGRRMEIAHLAAFRLTEQQIADRLGITRDYVRTLLREIRRATP